MTTFTGVEERWAQGLGSLRDVVRQHLVAEQMREVLAGNGPLHVLDAGCGQGTQALVTRLLTALTAVAAPGAVLSLLVRNGLAPAMSTLPAPTAGDAGP